MHWKKYFSEYQNLKKLCNKPNIISLPYTVGKICTIVFTINNILGIILLDSVLLRSFKSYRSFGFVLYSLLYRYLHRANSKVVRSGDLAGTFVQSICLSMQSLNNVGQTEHNEVGLHSLGSKFQRQEYFCLLDLVTYCGIFSNTQKSFFHLHRVGVFW